MCVVSLLELSESRPPCKKTTPPQNCRTPSSQLQVGEERTGDKTHVWPHSGSLPTLNPLLYCAKQGYFLFPTVRVSPILSFPHIFLHTALAPHLLSGPQLQLNKANTWRLPKNNQNEMNGL